MPRHGGNTLRPCRRHHKKMSSGSKGNGGDAKIRKAKQVAGEAAHPKPRKKNGKEEFEPT